MPIKLTRELKVLSPENFPITSTVGDDMEKHIHTTLVKISVNSIAIRLASLSILCQKKETLWEFSKAANWQVWKEKEHIWECGNKDRLCNPPSNTPCLEVYSPMMSDVNDPQFVYFSRLSFGQSLDKIMGCCEGSLKCVTWGKCWKVL